MTVSPFPTRLRVVAPPAPKPPPEPTHVVLQPAARHAFTALEGQIGRLRRIFSGPSTPLSAAAEIDRICGEIITEAQRVKRFSRT